FGQVGPGAVGSDLVHRPAAGPGIAPFPFIGPVSSGDGRAGAHLPGEKVCPMALELVKPGGLGRLLTGARRAVCMQVEWVLPSIRSAVPDSDRQLTEPGKYGARIENGRRPKRGSGAAAPLA